MVSLYSAASINPTVLQILELGFECTASKLLEGLLLPRRTGRAILHIMKGDFVLFPGMG